MRISIGYYESLNGIVKICEKKAGTIFPNKKGPLSDHMPSAASYLANNEVKEY